VDEPTPAAHAPHPAAVDPAAVDPAAVDPAAVDPDQPDQAGRDRAAAPARPAGSPVAPTGSPRAGSAPALDPHPPGTARDSTQPSTGGHPHPVGSAGPAGEPYRPAVPTPLRVTSEVSARLLVIAAAVGLLVYLVILLRVVVIPVAIAFLLAAALAPVVHWLVVRRVPRGPATALVLLGGLALLGGLLSFVVNTFINGFPALQAQLAASFVSVQELLVGPPLNLPADWLENVPAQLGQAVSDNRGALTTGALSTAATVGELAAGAALALFALIFFLYDGPQIWRYLLRAAPVARRDRVDVAGRRAFASLVGYTRATVLVAVVDAVGIGIGLWLVGVPLAVPLSALVFLGAFVPIVGAVLTGAVAVLIALVANGPVAALIILGVVLAVQQLEGNVLQPLLLGRAVQLHALAVVLAVAAGVVIAGIPGALLAVPLLAVVNTAVRSLTSSDEQVGTHVNAVDPRQAQPVAGPVEGPEGPGPGPGRLSRLRRRLPGQAQA
jgi:predicted PurR-regulated permease PerM